MDVLSTQLGGGNPPDVSGPNGIGGLASFTGQWTDLTPYLTKSAYDLSAYDPTAVKFYQDNGAQIGVPLDVYPSMLWYKRDFFEEAQIPEPPHEFGAKYKMADGTERVMKAGDFFHVPPGHDSWVRRRRALRLAAHPRQRGLRHAAGLVITSGRRWCDRRACGRPS